MTEHQTNMFALTPLDARILLADDEPVVLRVLSTYLTRRGAYVVLARNGADALEKLSSEQFELVITDVNMPGGSGLGLLDEVKARWPDLPVILMTGALDAETVVAALHSGADRYLLKPFSVEELGKRVEEALSKRNARLRERAERVEMEQRLAEQDVEVRSLVLRGVRALVEAVEAKDPYTRGHSERATEYALILGKEVGGTAPEWIRLGGELHDIGKIGVPDAVLNKPGALDDDEVAKVREHPVIGRRIIEPLIDVQDVQAMTLWHHERWDGKGYPDRLSRGGIPSAALVLAVADTLDAMTSSRAYRPAHSWELAVTEIRNQGGAQFAPDIVAAFDSCLPQLRHRYEELHPR